MILIDNEGNKIHASVKKFLIPDFKDVLKEGNYFVFTNFGVGAYGPNYKLVDHDCKINFYRSTKVCRCPEFLIVTDGYNTVSYDDLLEWNISVTVAFDVVGLLVLLQEMKVKRENGKRISCALWGDHASQLYDYVSKNKLQSDHIILLIHNAKLKEWQGKPQVSNQLFGCRVYINEDVNPITNFKNQLLSGEHGDPSSSQVSSLNVETVIKTAREYFTKPPTKTVDDIRATTEVSGCVVKATVIRISGDEGWYTYQCKSCGKRAGRIDDGKGGERLYDCDVCCIVKDVGSKIRTVIRIQDKTGSTSFVLFDNQLSKMLNRSVSWLNNKKDNVAGPHVVPDEFQMLIHKVDQTTAATKMRTNINPTVFLFFNTLSFLLTQILYKVDQTTLLHIRNVTAVGPQPTKDFVT